MRSYIFNLPLCFLRLDISPHFNFTRTYHEISFEEMRCTTGITLQISLLRMIWNPGAGWKYRRGERRTESDGDKRWKWALLSERTKGGAKRGRHPVLKSLGPLRAPHLAPGRCPSVALASEYGVFSKKSKYYWNTGYSGDCPAGTDRAEILDK